MLGFELFPLHSSQRLFSLCSCGEEPTLHWCEIIFSGPLSMHLKSLLWQQITRQWLIVRLGQRLQCLLSNVTAETKQVWQIPKPDSRFSHYNSGALTLVRAPDVCDIKWRIIKTGGCWSVHGSLEGVASEVAFLVSKVMMAALSATVPIQPVSY